MRSLPNFVWLKAFEAAGRSASFSLAAEELHLTPSAISHQVRNLEEHLGKALFERHNRRVSLNAEGQAFYRELLPILDDLDKLCRETQGAPTEADALTLHCAPSLAVKWLGPRLSAFMHANPSLAIHLRSDAQAPDLRQATDVDCVISYANAPTHDPYVVVEALESEPLVPLCSPKLYATLAMHQPWYMHLPLIDSALSPVTWAHWFGSKGMAAPLGPRLSFDRGAMAVAAAVDQLGVVLETVRFAEKEIENDQLMVLEAPDQEVMRREMHFLYYRNDLNAIRRLAKLRAWLLREAKFSVSF